MYSIRKILAITLALVMVLAMSVSVFAASFADLEGHWSKTFMEDLYERSLLTGYPDGTMKPENNITGAEALTFLAKLYKTNETEDAAIHEDFGKTVDALTSTAWVKPFLEKALAAGIISKDELAEMALFEPIPKEQLALFIVRAIKMEDDATLLAGTELEFGDVEEISEKCFTSVALLTKMEITVGDTKNNFGPQGDVTRAVAATMVSKILSYVEGSKTELTIDGYSGLSFASGLLTAVGNTSLTVRDEKGIFHVYDKAADFGASINGSSKTSSIGASLVGNPVELRLINGDVALAEITTETGVTYVQTKFVLATNKTGGMKTYDCYTGTTYNYDGMEATYTLNGESSYFVLLKENDFLTMRLEDKAVKLVSAVRGSFELEGEVSAISYSSITNVTLETEEGKVLLPLNVADLPEITRGGRSSSLEKLAVGDIVKVTYLGGEITKVAMEATTANATGTIVAITQTADGTKWDILNENGTTYSYSLAGDVIAYNGNNTVKASTFGIGDEVSLVVFDGEISEITMVKAHSQAAAESVQMTVKVISVDAKAKKFFATTEDGKPLYVQCDYSTTILDIVSGKIQLSALPENQNADVWGSYDTDGVFHATIIISGNK